MKSFVLERVLQPDDEPVSLAELKRHLRYYSDLTDDDDDLTALIRGGRNWVERLTGRALLDSRWRMTFGDHQSVFRNVDSDTVSGYYNRADDLTIGDVIQLRPSPVIEIVSFVSVASDDTETTVDSSTYTLRKQDSKWPELVRLSGATWGTGLFKIDMRCGWQDVESVPTEFIAAIKLWCEAHFDRDKEMMPLLLETAKATVMHEKADYSVA